MFILAVAAALLSVTGCSSDDSTSRRSAGTGSTTTTTASTAAPAPDEPADPNATTTIADLGGVAGPVDDCTRLSAKFSNLVQGMLGGADGASRSQQAAESMKPQLPARLQGAADTVASTYGAIAANGGRIDGPGVDTSAYEAAVTSFADYFSHDCKG